MKGKKSITLSSKKPGYRPTYQGYSYAFKVAIVDQVENGQMSANQAAKLYEVSPSAIRKWVKKYGNLDSKLLQMKGKSPKQEISELKKKLRKAEKERNIWKIAVEIIEEEYGLDVKKKYLSNYDKSILKDMENESTSD